MKKTITTTTTKTIECCDLCEKDCSNGFHNDCYVCGRRCCLRCSRLIEFADIDHERKRRILELPLKICCQCEAVGKKLHHIERMEGAIAGADVKVLRLLDEWRELEKLNRLLGKKRSED